MCGQVSPPARISIGSGRRRARIIHYLSRGPMRFNVHGARLIPVIDALGDWFDAAPGTPAPAVIQVP